MHEAYTFYVYIYFSLYFSLYFRFIHLFFFLHFGSNPTNHGNVMNMFMNCSVDHPTGHSRHKPCPIHYPRPMETWRHDVITLPTRQRLHFLTLKSPHTCVYGVHVLHTCLCSITVCVRVCTLYTYICMFNTSYTQYT
jgi:hypothetical protein